jgi:hypothetical protein
LENKNKLCFLEPGNQKASFLEKPFVSFNAVFDLVTGCATLLMSQPVLLLPAANYSEPAS